MLRDRGKLRRRATLAVLAALATAGALVVAVTGAAAPAAITIDVTASPYPEVAAGGPVLLSAVITNTGGGMATHVVYKLQAPAGSTVLQASSPDGTCTVTAAEAVCNLANMGSGDVATVEAQVTAAAVFDQISVTIDENANDSDPNGGKTDTFFAPAVSLIVRTDTEEFVGGCLADGVTLKTGGTLSGSNPVITRTQVVGGDGLCTPYTIEEVSSGDGCPPGANCKMPQYVDVLFPDPDNPVTIIVQTIVEAEDGLRRRRPRAEVPEAGHDHRRQVPGGHQIAPGRRLRVHGVRGLGHPAQGLAELLPASSRRRIALAADTRLPFRS